jgi:enoyl-CoA hydratase/carnithine racemase
MVLASTGKVFCAGFDLKAPPADIADPAARRSGVWQEVFLAMADFPKPLVVAVNGAAVGLGCMFVMLADHVVCVADAYISLPEIKHGMTTPVGYTITKFGLNHSIAAEMTLAARPVTLASVAHLKRSETVSPEALLERALAIAGELAAYPAEAFRNNKRWINLQLRKEINEAFAAGASFREKQS